MITLGVFHKRRAILLFVLEVLAIFLPLMAFIPLRVFNAYLYALIPVGLLSLAIIPFFVKELLDFLRLKGEPHSMKGKVVSRKKSFLFEKLEIEIMAENGEKRTLVTTAAFGTDGFFGCKVSDSLENVSVYVTENGTVLALQNEE